MGAARLEQWSVVTRREDTVWTPPEDRVTRLHGFVYGHERFPDGHEIVTTRIVRRDKDRKLVYTRNTSYSLGDVDPEYLEEYPDAEERIWLS